MMTPEPGWELYRTFLGVLREGSLSGAARALGIAQPTVGRHVQALEAALGTALFTRSQLGLAPTETALALEPYAQSLADTSAALLRAASGAGPGVRGTVRVTASDVIGIEVLPPILAALRRQHPALVVELVLTDDIEDLLRREADIAVRMTRPTQEALVARRVGTIEVGLHAHRDYLATHTKPTRWEDLAAHSLIGYDTETAFTRSLAKSVGTFGRKLFALRTDSNVAQLAAIRAGFGIGVCQVGIARRDRALVRVLARQFSLPLDTWVAMHEGLRATLRCKVVFDALHAGLAAYVAGRPAARR
jgi:DNA-binding transcriptional LysR family regulator